MDQITEASIIQCLQNQTDYKNAKHIKQAIVDDHQQHFQLICNCIVHVLQDNSAQPIQKLLAVRLAKDLISTFNKKFVSVFENIVLPHIRPIAEYLRPSADPNRGANYFGDNATNRPMGISIVRLALDCIKAWAMFFPTVAQGGQPTKFMQLYLDLVHENVNFPTWAYFKEEEINKGKNNEYDLAVNRFQNLMAATGHIEQAQHEQPQKVAASSQQLQQHVTPGQTPGAGGPGQVKHEASLILESCEQLFKRTAVLCAQTPISHYEPHLFDGIQDEAMAKGQQMDQTVNNLLEIDDEDMAGHVMEQMDHLKVLEDDITKFKKQSQFWPQFRKQYIGQEPDVAEKAQQELRQKEEEQRKQQQLQQAELARQHEQAELARQQQAELARQQQAELARQQQAELARQQQAEQTRQQQQALARQFEQAELARQQKEKEQAEHDRKQWEIAENERRENERKKYEASQQHHEQEEQFKSPKLQQKQSENQSNNSSQIMQQYQSVIGNSQGFSQKPLSHGSKRARSPFGMEKHQGDSHQTIPDVHPPTQPPQQNNEAINQLKQQLEQKQQEYNRLLEQHTALQQDHKQDKLQIQQLHDQISQQQQIINSLESQKQGNNQNDNTELKLSKLLQQKTQQCDQTQQALEQTQTYVNQLQFQFGQASADKQKLELHNKQLLDQVKNLQHQHDTFKQTIHDQQGHSHQQEIMQLQNTLTKHIQDKEIMKAQLDKSKPGEHQELAGKHQQALLRLRNVEKELDDVKFEKQQLHHEHAGQIDQHKFHLSEKQKIVDQLTDHLDLHKMKLDKLTKDYDNQAEKHKKSKEEFHKQVIDAKRESNQKQVQIEELQLQMNEKNDEIKQLKLSYNALEAENNQLKKLNESSTQQIAQLMSMLQNNNSSAKSATPLLQQKLQQTLDELDRVKKEHSKSLNEQMLDMQAQIDQLQAEKSDLLSKLQQLQSQQMIGIPEQNFQQIPIQQLQLQMPDMSRNSFHSHQTDNKSKQVCPLPLFKHFPEHMQFQQKQLYVAKPKEIAADCLDIIFPYQDPKEYYKNKAKKQRKGRLISSSNSYQVELSHLDILNKALFKQRCLGTNGQILVNSEVKVGLMFQNQINQGKYNFTFGLYVQNQEHQLKNFQLQFVETESLQTFWADPAVVRKQLQEDEQLLIQIIVSGVQFPLQILTAQVTTGMGHPFHILIPNHICQLVAYRDVKNREFIHKWRALTPNMIRSDLLVLNMNVFESVQNLITMIPRLCILNHHKTNDYDMGIDELKLGGCGSIFDNQFWIKFEILPDNQICIFLTYDLKYSNNKIYFEQVLQGYAYILGDGKSKSGN